jgi:hypothetical protein
VSFVDFFMTCLPVFAQSVSIEWAVAGF